MEWLIYIFVAAIAFAFGWTVGKQLSSKDDGIVIINRERVEVIFRDPYEELVKKKYVNLKIQS